MQAAVLRRPLRTGLSRNELARSEDDAEIYRLYRVVGFRDGPRILDVPGAIAASCDLETATYVARLRSQSQA